jgi:CelD/BcsL family acetyltransferase involved in cellulose biosynthesis
MSSPSLVLTRHDSLSGLQDCWTSLLSSCEHDTVFLTWDWHDAWWRTHGSGELHVLTVECSDKVVGIAPLVREADRWGIGGGVEVADFLDIVAAPNYADDVACAVLDYVSRYGGSLELRNLRPRSIGATSLFRIAEGRGLSPILEREDVSPRLDLPGDWNSYLMSLNKKDRHELRRKLRRLYAAGVVDVTAVTDRATRAKDIADYLNLHRLSAENKASFMTPAMEAFFRDVVDEFAPRDLLRLYFLTLDGVRVAAVILFDYGGEFLLYNSGYDPAYSHLSAGLLLKAFCIRDAIAEGRRGFDFLQGNEPYKYDLGATDVPILRMRVELGAAARESRSFGNT